MVLKLKMVDTWCFLISRRFRACTCFYCYVFFPFVYLLSFRQSMLRCTMYTYGRWSLHVDDWQLTVTGMIHETFALPKSLTATQRQMVTHVLIITFLHIWDIDNEGNYCPRESAKACLRACAYDFEDCHFKKSDYWLSLKHVLQMGTCSFCKLMNQQSLQKI